MIKLDYAIEDVYGITYDAAIVAVRTANQSHNSDLYVNETTESTMDEPFSQTARTAVTFNAYIYKNEEAKAAGKKPMNLKSENGLERFSFDLEKPVSTAAELIQACEEHLVSVVLPAFKI